MTDWRELNFDSPVTQTVEMAVEGVRNVEPGDPLKLVVSKLRAAIAKAKEVE